MDRRDDLNLNDPAHTAGRNADVAREVPVAGDAGEKAAGSAVGGVGGAAAGAAVGTVVAGPIGTAIGAIAGALGGWWAGHASSVAADVPAEDDSYYRSHYETGENRLADRSYDDVRPAYQLGHVARHHPEYEGKSFDEIEPHLRRGWTDDLRARHGEWDHVRRYASEAYTRHAPRGTQNPDMARESVSERTVLGASERARDRLAGGRGGLTRDDTTGF